MCQTRSRVITIILTRIAIVCMIVFGAHAYLNSPFAATVRPSNTSSLHAVPEKNEPSFESWWRDGMAEMNGYDFKISRYGEERRGEAVMIFVTEPFSRSAWVKRNDPSLESDDAVEVLKLNFVRDFQTGVYDYNTMTSLFVAASDFDPLKITFSSAEWCGHVYEEALLDRATIREKYFSYFEGESFERESDRPEDGIFEEELYILLRGLRGAYLQPGETRPVAFMQEMFFRRLEHQPSQWTTAVIARTGHSESVTVPAGKFTADRYTIAVEGGRTGEIMIESAHPHRVILWNWRNTAGATTARLGGGTFSGALTGSERMAYWKLHGERDTNARQRMGLTAARP